MLRYVNHDIVFREFPDEVTLAVNLSGCPLRCPGCHSPWLQTDAGEELTETRLSALVDDYAGAVTCVALMGGDADASAVARLLGMVKRRYGGRFRTGWYSGGETLPEGFCLSAFDYVKLGAWRAARGPLSSATTNQRLYRVADGRLTDITFRLQRPWLGKTVSEQPE